MHTSLAPTMSASFSVIAERFRRAGQFDRAVSLCREGLTFFPDHLSARVTLGCALLDLGQFADSHRELQMVLKRAPDNLAAIRGLADLHARGIEGQDAHDLDDAAMAENARASLIDAQMATSFYAEEVLPAGAELSSSVNSEAFGQLELEIPIAREMPAVHEIAEVPAEWLAVPAVAELPQAAMASVVMVAEAEPAVGSMPRALVYDEPVDLDRFDPAVAEATAPIATIEPVAPFAFAAVESMPLDEFDPVVEARVEYGAPLAMAVAPQIMFEEFDPVVDVKSMVFEIEDVLEHADDEPEPIVAAARELECELELAAPPSPITVMDDWLMRIQVRRDAGAGRNGTQGARADTLPPLSGSSEGPITVLDDWLTRIQARRSKLLSQYAAG